jgi:recombination protein RecR
MKLIPNSLQALVHELSRLPGVGERTALRYAVALLKAGPRRISSFESALSRVAQEISHCPLCHFWMQENQCALCSDASRNNQRLCVVRDAPDVLAFEKFKNHPWRYHVLQGLLSPLSGVGPSQIRLDSLYIRLAVGDVNELIVALDATVEGDATGLFIRDHMKKNFPSIKVTRTALGLPAGSSVEFLDSSTLESALQHRTTYE